MDKEKFVQNIKYYCKLKGVKPTPACRDAGVGSSFINSIERGQTPSVKAVQRLAEYLGVTTSDLLGEQKQVEEISKVRQKLYDIIERSSEPECEKLLDLINLYYGLEQDAAERRRTKKTAPPESEAVQIKEPLFEAGTQVEPGTYVCVDCGKTHVNIHDAGETFPQCGICNSMYYRKITKQFS